MRAYVGCTNNPEEYKLCKALGAIGVLTNSNGMLEVYGPDMTLSGMTQQMLDQSEDLLVFTAIHGKSVEDIVDLAHKLSKLSPSRVGVKIISNVNGFAAMRQLSSEGIRCIATGMFTYEQAYMAALAGAYAISPFLGRGNEAGLDMADMIHKTRVLYDRLGVETEILAASIHNCEEARIAFESGADSVAVGIKTLCEMCENPLSVKTELSFGAAFANIKGEDVSYLDFDESHSNYQE